jgi:hypothetical protein
MLDAPARPCLLGRATSVVAPRSRPHDEAGDTREIRSDHAVLAGGDRNRRPTRRPALRRRACAPNGKSSTRDCPGSPDGPLSSGTAYSEAASTQSAAQGDWLLKAGIEFPEVPAQSLYTTPLPPRRVANADQGVLAARFLGPPTLPAIAGCSKNPSSPPLISPTEFGHQF